MYTHSDSYRRALGRSRFAYFYNPAGFEVAFAMEVFGSGIWKREEKLQEWISGQVKRSFDFDSGLMTKGAEDPETLAARIYEATRLADREIIL